MKDLRPCGLRDSDLCTWGGDFIVAQKHLLGDCKKRVSIENKLYVVFYMKCVCIKYGCKVFDRLDWEDRLIIEDFGNQF